MSTQATDHDATAGTATDAVAPTSPATPLPDACAYWTTPEHLVWPATLLPEGTTPAHTTLPTFTLLASSHGGLTLHDGTVPLAPDDLTYPLRPLGPVPDELATRHPQLRGGLLLSLTDDYGTPLLERPDVEDLLTYQLALFAQPSQPTQPSQPPTTRLTGVQTWPLLDHLYATGDAGPTDATHAPLGVTWDREDPTTPRPRFALWAPTARAVTLLTWDTGDPTGSTPVVPGPPTATPAHRRPDGTWRVPNGEAHIHAGCQYLWEVTVHHPTTGRTQTLTVTDPYAKALTTDSRRAVAIDPTDPALAPHTWAHTPSPHVERDAARAIYELHLRQFSATDTTCPQHLRGTYLALTQAAGPTAGRTHLAELAHAGIDTLHLLPIFDFTSVPEDRADRHEPQAPTPPPGPASRRPQDAVAATRDHDSYNWGYDPWHWGVPEGSYATAGHQDGGARLIELREMVGAVHALGMQVILDQVFNHTAAAGTAPHSVLDRIVPGYYHRLDATGTIHTSACGANVATEHAMAERLMIDTCVSWIRDHHVDGFRLDLMGYHSTTTIRRLRHAIDTAALDTHGHPAFLYGEGWNMGEVADNALFEQAVQGALAGTRVATFNDRLRDALLGGSVFDPDPRARQGLGTGELTDPSPADDRPHAVTLRDLAWRSDLVRAALAGGLADYPLMTEDGTWRRAADLGYGGGPAAYGTDPVETLNYVTSHDNETLYDALAYKLPPSTPMTDRVRMVIICLALVTLGQSPALWEAGSEMLRSTSLDTDAYDSGDWFTAHDWSGATTGWGKGLPGQWRNFDRWVIQAELLADPRLAPTPQDTATCRALALDLLRLRRSTPLLTLGDARLIHERVSFPCSGPSAVPGLIVMAVDDGCGEQDIDPELDGVVLAVNTSPKDLEVRVDALVGRDLELSPIQAHGTDDTVRRTSVEASTGTLRVPARTAALLIER